MITGVKGRGVRSTGLCVKHMGRSLRQAAREKKKRRRQGRRREAAVCPSSSPSEDSAEGLGRDEKYMMRAREREREQEREREREIPRGNEGQRRGEDVGVACGARGR